MAPPPTDTTDLSKAIREFENALPGWWWSIGHCMLTRHASCGPDVQGQDAWLLPQSITADTPALQKQIDAGFHCDDLEGTLASSLRNVMKQALKAKAEYSVPGGQAL
jgi:hypothetical protein